MAHCVTSGNIDQRLAPSSTLQRSTCAQTERLWPALAYDHRLCEPRSDASQTLPIPSLVYNGRVDRANAIRLLKALITAGANSNVLMANTWVDDIAQREVSLRRTELPSALAYAAGQGWIADGPRQGWTIITREGERAARLRIVLS